MRCQEGSFIMTQIFLIILVVSCSKLVTSSPIQQQMSLYNTSDHVTILNGDNFYDTLLGKQHAWFLQFYSSYCGHCISFAPEFKLFTKNISDWSHTIQPAVLNCAEEQNTGICRQYEVVGYPTLVFLPANTSKDDLGKQLQIVRTIPGMRKSIITYLMDQQAAGNGSSSWVNLLPFNGSTDELFAAAHLTQTEAVIFVDIQNSTMAQEALMDIGYFNELIIVRWMVNGTGLLEPLNPSSLPTIVLLDRHTKQPRLLQDTFLSTVHLVNTAINELGLETEILPSYRIQQEETSATEEGLGAGDGSNGDTNQGSSLNEQLNTDKLNYDDNLPDHYYSPESASVDQVFLVDVENALTYILNQEVALHKHISGERLQALKQFLSVLVKYLPMRPRVHAYLSDLSKSVASVSSSMSNVEYGNALVRASRHGVLPDQQDWVGCRGSKRHLRGYACSLWTTFHLLTVNVAANPEQMQHPPDPLETLRAIHDFVKHFYSCTYCSQHFQEMYAVDAETFVTSHDDSIIWLWKAHNKVNKRLAGEPSEDPKHPKIQYPPRSHCPKCWKEASPLDPFKRREVLAYLKKVYAKGSISLQYVVRPGRNAHLSSSKKKG